MFRNTSKKRQAVVSLTAAAVVAMSVAAVATAGGEGKVREVEGAITGSPPSDGPDCPSPIDLCATAELTGTIHGPATAVANSLTPTTEPNVSVVVADVVIHDPRGDLRCTESVVLDVSPGGDGEEGWICQVTGGTGYFAGVSGHIEGFGSVPPGERARGRYGGRLTFP